MSKLVSFTLHFSLPIILLASACVPQAESPASGYDSTSASAEKPVALKVLASNSMLANITHQVAGNRLEVDSLIPLGLDLHAFEPTPQDIARIAESQMIVVNGSGLEEWVQEAIDNAGGEHLLVEASSGLTMREPAEDVTHEGETEHEHEAEDGHHHHEGDPHFWLNPMLVVQYTLNIRDGLIQVDPQGKDSYTANADQYILQLQELDEWIKGQVDKIPADRRLLVTNHESFGYFADQYGFTVIGTIIPSVTTGSTPTAREMEALVEHIQENQVKVVFLETGSNPKLAEQIAAETGVQVVTELYTHSLTTPDGNVPSYIAMMKWNTSKIVDALQ